MSAWVNEMLDRFAPDEELCALQKAVERADKGNIEPLREALLQQTGYDLGRFLQKSERKRKDDRVYDAAIDAKIIWWWIWKRNYPKQPTGISAVEIAAARYKVTDEQVKNKLKKISAVEIPPRDSGREFLRFPRRQNPIWYWLWDNLPR
jgi:hypothetical protein